MKKLKNVRRNCDVAVKRLGYVMSILLPSLLKVMMCINKSFFKITVRVTYSKIQFISELKPSNQKNLTSLET